MRSLAGFWQPSLEEDPLKTNTLIINRAQVSTYLSLIYLSNNILDGLQYAKVVFIEKIASENDISVHVQL